VATVRPATVADADAIAQAHVRAWQVAYRGLISDAHLDALDWRERAALRRELLSRADPDGVHTAVVVDPGVTGFVAWGPVRDDDTVGSEVFAVYVDPSWWGRGHGTLLLDHAKDAVAADAELTLWVLEGNARARRFYERAGFVEDGASKSAEFGGQEVRELRYRLDRSAQVAPSER
jgi:GNAT superfamily N-acetyltransferase